MIKKPLIVQVSANSTHPRFYAMVVGVQLKAQNPIFFFLTETKFKNFFFFSLIYSKFE
jgi:hypothetical protein